MESLIEIEDFPGRLLHQAALWDNAELLEDLLNGDELSCLNARDSWGRTALHAAATNENSQCLRILTQAGADLDAVSGPRAEGRTALHVAAEHGHASNVSVLVEAGANLMARDHLGLTPLDLADKAEHTECMSVLRAAADRQEAQRMETFALLQESCAQGDLHAVRSILNTMDHQTVANLINFVPKGNNTLLFRACENGHKEVVSYLLDKGADGQVHPVTKYSPLYIAAYNGKKEVVEVLLKKFPELATLLTVERWTPLHGACINGHLGVFDLLLKYPFPKSNLKLIKEADHEYEVPFDFNLRDVTGQTLLYMACCVANIKIIESLLQYKVKARRILSNPPSRTKQSLHHEIHQPISPSKKQGVSMTTGIQALISKLRGVSVEEELGPDEFWMCPIDVNLYCNNGTETVLHHIVKKHEHAIAQKLLAAGADPNLIIYATESPTSSSPSSSSTTSSPISSADERCYYKGSSCLVEACKNRDMGMIDLLIKYSARDDDCKALGIALKADDEIVASKLLTLKAHQDPENTINKKGVAEVHNHTGIGPAGFASVGSLAYSSIFPSTAVMINWHDQGRITRIRESWLIDAAVRLNPKLRLSPKCQQSALHAITRLDLSNNDLREIPICVFQMQSLKTLFLSQNKLDSLPMTSTPKKTTGKIKQDDSIYRCPWLEEIQLQDNRLEYLPPAIFSLKSLTTLDVSNNKLTFLPFEIWQATQLKELNISFNMLSELPVYDVFTRERSFSKTSSISGGADVVSLSDLSQQDESVDTFSETTSEKNVDVEKSFEDCRARRCHSEELIHHSLWSVSVDVIEKSFVKDDPDDEGMESSQQFVSQLQSFNLAHNSFKIVPKCLSCLAPSLNRLNLSYNLLSKMGSVTSYPAALKHLDLSHNQIDSWLGENSSLSSDNVCYASPDNCDSFISENKRISSRISRMSSTKLGCCQHKKHVRLENLRTLILADNRLDKIPLYNIPDGDSNSTLSSNEENEVAGSMPIKQKIMFPALSMIDLSENRIHEVPANIHELTNLSVLNLSGNHKLNELPPQMGLLHKLWNLNTRGCNLQEPLATMMNSKAYKTSDVVGYLRSVLENSKLYARLKLMVVGIQGIGKTTLLELLRQEGGSFKRKPVEHWAKRMGNKNVNMKTGRGVSISTVGVDIGDWTFEKKDRGSPSFGPVVFRTWDFGGQTEYYATHQYFLSKRSLYLVVWKMTDGKKGMNEIQQWLINIQARAPNSPVIIVGTHMDVVKDEFPPSFSEYLQQKIREKFINIADPEKCGLPKVLDSIEVSCKTRQNIKLLSNLLYDTAYSLRTPGSSTKLLEVKIPATYLALEDVVGQMASELRAQGQDPVLNHEEFKNTANRELLAKHGLKFRDSAEINQATKFLHENGVILHYEDATLRDLYFLDPQWLCDMLSHVVTIREINPFARNGLMRLEDLRHVFKSSTSVSLTAKSYIVNLLNKFEVALTWDSRTLLIPSLLPTEQKMRSGVPGLDMRVKIPVRSRGFGFRGRRNNPGVPFGLEGLSQEKASARSRSVPGRMLISAKDISKPTRVSHEFTSQRSNAANPSDPEYEMTRRSEPEHAIQRLILMSYFPSGFWSRLLTRILADDSVVEIVRSYFMIPDEVRQDPILSKIFLEHKPEWVCWQTGLELRYLETTLFSMKQVMSNVVSTYDYHSMKIVLFQDDKWSDLDTQNSSILEISLPQDTVVIKRPVLEKNESSNSDKDPIGYRAVALDPNPKSVCQLLALAVEATDLLLEDWYPSLGTRFLHTSEGRMLVTRLVPCNFCLTIFNEREPIKSWQDWSFLDVSKKQKSNERLPRVSQESAASDKDSGMGQESPPGPEEDIGGQSEASILATSKADERVYAFLVEECILHAFDGKNAKCPKHGDLHLGQIAPDTVFLDLDDRLRIPQESVKRGGLIGRGAFGFVYEAACRQRGMLNQRNVAIKMLQPIHPGLNASDSTLAAFKAGLSKWERDPLQYACKAYCTARQELNILIHLKHPHIVPLVGICVNPLSIVLELAPVGALDQQLKHYRRSGDKLSAKVVQLIILQIARALEYLHQQHIIYRDLKSENVLVWQIPGPFSQKPHENPTVFTKLADYGISRPTLPTGAKGFGGTEGFMAPEIVKYNGEEEYTEKVDCFSFGMFIYELLTLHQPFVGYETVKELILEGGRPPLTHRELTFPTNILDLMVVCWSHRPRERPSASQIVSIASAPEFLHLSDAVSIDQGSCCSAVVTTPNRIVPTSELWMACSSGFTDGSMLRVLEVGAQGQFDVMTQIDTKELQGVTSMCVVDKSIWIGDNEGYVRAYCSDTYELLFIYKMEPDGGNDLSPVRAIHFLPELRRTCVAMHNGRMFLCNCDVRPTSEVGGEGTFLVTELGSSSCIHSVASVRRGSSVEIWCGGSHGSVSVFILTDGVVTSQEVSNHHDPVVENAEVLQIIGAPPCPTSSQAFKAPTKDKFLWTFIYPGCHIYQWDADVRAVKNKLDCSKLVPCSESLKTIAIDEHFSPGRCQVASMAIYDQKLYVGTSWGCLIIAEALTMRPITVFRPFSEEVQAIIPIVGPTSQTGSTASPLRSVSSTDDRSCLIATLGKGYRKLLDRYVVNRRSPTDEDESDDNRTTFALLWRPDSWLSD